MSLREIISDVGGVAVVVRVVGLFVEPETGTSFPLNAASEAELGAAATGHVVAAFDLLDRGAAVVAALPTLSLGDLDEFLGRGVFGTFARGVPFIVT